MSNLKVLKTVKLILTTWVLSKSAPCLANIRIFVIQSSFFHEKYLIPVLDHETVEMALNRYKRLVSNDPGLSDLITQDQLSELKVTELAHPLESNSRPSILILTNRGYDLSNEQKSESQLRVAQFKQKFTHENNFYLLPIAASIGLTRKERKQFYEKLSEMISGVVALGGQDIDPKIYNQPNKYSKDTQYKRDLYEIHFLKYWIKSESGFLLGVCRGFQLILAAYGLKLTQHIENHGENEWVYHPIQILKTTHNFLFQSATLKRAEVNSYHHQGIGFFTHPEIEVSALSHDQVVEAFESKNGLVIGTQFHIEFMESRFIENLFDLFKNKIKFRKLNQCRQIFK